ncbi:MAG: hypothetical protein FK734_10205 [Asgard group archaeon]|nr:hypothetical protein [Asgard group archaeon]
MNKKIGVIVLITIIAFTMPINILDSSESQVKASAITFEDLAYYWAPVWYQDVDDTCCQADFILTFDFDGNWIGSDNWENLDLANCSYCAGIYYSVVETETHYFIGYYDFHPRDWTEIVVLQHENDLEGVLVVIQKDTSDWGQFICMITESHNHLYQYKDYNTAPSMYVSNGYDDIDGDVEFQLVDNYAITMPFVGHNHPIVYVDCWGHGVHGDKRWEITGFPGGDGVIYKPLGMTEEPANISCCNVGYNLIPIDIFWDLRVGPFGEGQTMGGFSSMDGDTYGEDSASLPWGWDDPDDGPTFVGEIFYNPANLVDVHLNGLGNFSRKYVYNPYAMEITIDSYKVNWDEDGENDNTDGFLNLYLIDGKGEYSYTNWGDGVLDGDSGTQYSWIGWDMPIDQWVDMHEEIPMPFYGISYPEKPLFGIRSKDWDDVTRDAWLMNKKETHWYGVQGTPAMEGERVHTVTIGQDHYDWGGSEAMITVNITVNAMYPSPTSSGASIYYYVAAAGVIILVIVIASVVTRRRKKYYKW